MSLTCVVDTNREATLGAEGGVPDPVRLDDLLDGVCSDAWNWRLERRCRYIDEALSVITTLTLIVVGATVESGVRVGRSCRVDS